MEKVILLSAKAQHGKDSTAQYLKEQFQKQGKKVAIMHFAKYIKQLVKEFYYPNWDGVTKSNEIRNLLQQLGTDKIRKELKKPLFHCSRVCEDIQIISGDYDIVIIPDCRFKNEILYTKAMFPEIATIIRINRLGFVSPLTTEQQQHESEINLDDFNFDYTVYVQSGLDHLYDEVDRMFKGKWY